MNSMVVKAMKDTIDRIGGDLGVVRIILVLLGGGVAGAVGLAQEDPPGAVIFALVMALSSGLLFYLNRALGQGRISVDDQGLVIEMGRLFQAFIPPERVKLARKFSRPSPGFGLNLGIHIGLGGSVDMTVGLGPGVELGLDHPCPARVFGLPLSVRKVRISLDEADFFLTYVNSLMEKRK